MSGHTPGPWYVGELLRWAVYAHKDGRPFRSKIADCDVGPGIPTEEHEANARLIAQSPMLLSSAKHAMKVIERTVFMNEEWLRPADANALRGVLEDLDELITRVEGKP